MARNPATLLPLSALALSGLFLAACAGAEAPSVTPPAPPPPAVCMGEAGQKFLGQKATAELGAQLLEATGAASLRWVPPRTAVTMDYRADRLTVTYDDDMRITRVSCT